MNPVGNNIHDIKPPLAIANGWEWVWWTLDVLMLAGLLYFIWWLWRNERSRVPAAPPVPAHVRARRKLAEALALIGQPKSFCTLVSDTIRLYLEERFNFHAPERTTEEFLHELQSTDRLAGEQKEKLGEFLESCDLVKFAKYEPGEPELRGLHAAALRLVEETEPKGTPAEIVNRESGHEPQPAREIVNQRS